MSLTPNGLYWNQVNGGTGLLGDPLVSPDPDGSPVFDAASPLGGAAYGFGGHDYGTGSLESTAVAGNILSVQSAGSMPYYLSLTLDSASDPDSDTAYPSWGTFSNIAVQQWDGVSWTAYNPTWLVSPTSPAGGTVQGAGSVTVGAGEVGAGEGGSQTSAIYGIGATLPSSLGYKVFFDTDLKTWDSYSLSGGNGGGPGGGQGTLNKGGNVVPPLTLVPGKEYSNLPDETFAGAPDPLQNIAFDGIGNAWDTFDYTGSGIPDFEVDALANSLDAYFLEVINDEVPMMLSFATPDLKAGDIKYQMAQADIVGTWATPVQINAVSPPDDVDGLELWGPEQDDANMFSLNGDPMGVSVYRYDSTTHMSTPYIQKAALMTAIDTNEAFIDLDALMVWDVDGDDYFGGGDIIMFSIEETITKGGVFDGGEVWVWHGGGGPAAFLWHGGELWNTAHQVGVHFGVNTEEVNALEAVPEPVTLTVLLISSLALLRRRC